MTEATISKLNEMAARALSRRVTVHASYLTARAAIEMGVPGDFVECGVFAGANAAAMALAIMDSQKYGRDGHNWRRVHLYDSFEGVPAAGQHDREWIESNGTVAGISASPMSEVERHMEEWGIEPGLLVYRPGWFAQTVTDPYPDKIAVLRLDADLYQSTAECIDALWPRLSPRGWCIVDDFDLEGARKAVLERIHTGPIYFLKPEGDD